MTESDELLAAWKTADQYIGDFLYLFKIPFEEWPEEYQAISGVSEELLGPAD